MNLLGIAVLVVGALVVAYAFRFVGQPLNGYRWLITTVGAAIGGFVASESLGSLTTVGPELDGLFVVPALIGGIVLGGVVEWVVRTVTPEPARTTAH